jgi:hypothetical protein
MYGLTRIVLSKMKLESLRDPSLQALPSLKFGFNTLTDDGHIIFRQTNVPDKISNMIKESLELPNENNYIISFSRFVNFDPNVHGPPITYFLSDMDNHIKRKVIGEDEKNYQVTYKFKNKLEIKKFSKDQIILLCGIFHQLNLQKFLVPCVKYLMAKYKMSFEEIKILTKSDMYKINIFV